MSTWVIISWIFVGILTAINIVVFLQLKKASEQMMKMAGMASMLKGVQGGAKGMGGGSRGGARTSDAQLKAAMELLQKANKGKR